MTDNRTTERKGICKTCGWCDTNNCACGYGVVDRYRGIKEPCGWWKRKRKRKTRGDAE